MNIIHRTVAFNSFKTKIRKPLTPVGTATHNNNNNNKENVLFISISYIFFRDMEIIHKSVTLHGMKNTWDIKVKTYGFVFSVSSI